MMRTVLTLLTSFLTMASVCLLTCPGLVDCDAPNRQRRIGDRAESQKEDTQHTLSTFVDASNSEGRFSSRKERVFTKGTPSKQQSPPTDRYRVLERRERVTRDTSLRYGVLLDAGSSSTKVKVYSYTPGTLPSFVPHVRLEVSRRVKPGLGEFVSTQSGLPEYIKKGLDEAKDYVPRALHASTPVYLMATAGLRTLPVQEAKALLGGVVGVMEDTTINPFLFSPSHVSILSGEEEAVYAWLAVNYLRGFFSSNMTRADSVGLLEMGGGSMQVAFLPDGPLYQEEFQVYVGRRRFDLYAQTYLSFGSTYITDQVRRALMDDGSFMEGKLLNSPCMLSGDTSKYLSGNMAIKVRGTGQANECEQVLSTILNPSRALLCSPSPCAIGDTYQPAVGDLPFYAISAFQYAPKGLKAIERGDVLNMTKLQENAWKYCSLTVDQAVAQTGTKPEFASNDCLMGLYIPLLLTSALGFDTHTRSVLVTNTINNTRIDWALGAMIQQLSMAFMDDLESIISCRHGNKPMPVNTEKQTRASSDASGSQQLTLTFILVPVLLITWLLLWKLQW